MAGHGCLNNPRVRALGRARLREAIEHYPDVDGIFLDWTEYTCYFLEDCFTCFCEHCQAAADGAGLRLASHRARHPRALGPAPPPDARRPGRRRQRRRASRLAVRADWTLLAGYPGVADLLRFKADSVRDAAADLRRTMDEAGASGVALGLNGFAPPWNLVTGMEYAAVHQVVQATRCKLFTFHWPMIVRWWSETLLAWNPGLDEQAVLRAVQAALDLPPPPGEHRRTLAEYGMPRPDEPHPIAMEALTRKIEPGDRAADRAGRPKTAWPTSTATARPPSSGGSWRRCWRARRRAAGSSATAT